MSDRLELNGKAVHSQVVEFFEKLGKGSIYKGLHEAMRELEHKVSSQQESMSSWFTTCVQDGDDVDVSDHATVSEIKNSYLKFCRELRFKPATISELYSYLGSKGYTKGRISSTRYGYKKIKLANLGEVDKGPRYLLPTVPDGDRI